MGRGSVGQRSATNTPRSRPNASRAARRARTSSLARGAAGASSAPGSTAAAASASQPSMCTQQSHQRPDNRAPHAMPARDARSALQRRASGQMQRTRRRTERGRRDLLHEHTNCTSGVVRQRGPHTRSPAEARHARRQCRCCAPCARRCREPHGGTAARHAPPARSRAGRRRRFRGRSTAPPACCMHAARRYELKAAPRCGGGPKRNHTLCPRPKAANSRSVWSMRHVNAGGMLRAAARACNAPRAAASCAAILARAPGYAAGQARAAHSNASTASSRLSASIASQPRRYASSAAAASPALPPLPPSSLPLSPPSPRAGCASPATADARVRRLRAKRERSFARQTGSNTRCERACSVARAARAGALVRRRRRRGGAMPHVSPVFAGLRQPERRLCGGADTRRCMRTCAPESTQPQQSAARCALATHGVTHRRARAAPLPAARAAAAPPHR